jgi:hypothetical protein
MVGNPDVIVRLDLRGRGQFVCKSNVVDVTGFEPATPCLQIQKTNLDGEKENE